MSVDGFEKLSSAVTALMGQPEPAQTSAPAMDQFTAFGETVVHRLRSMDEEDALAAMADISAIIFRKRGTFFTM